MKGFSGFKSSPAKQQDSIVIDGKTYPKGYTKKDVEFLKKQREDVVRYEDLDEKGKAIWNKRMQDAVKKKGMHIPKKKKSPAKQSINKKATQIIDGVLCDAYGRPIDPKKKWEANINKNYKGPGGRNDSDKVMRGQNFRPTTTI